MIRAPLTLLAGFGVALVFATASPARAELSLCNRTSYRMEAALGLEKRASVATRGWIRLDPGQCRQVLDGPLDADMVYVHARTPSLYGSPPQPQNGEFLFCIRDGDFEFADARDCPIGQQAHFSPARPSDTPKGPTINLAEASDYDDEQARLAGIQRLLVIAGYDATPIDGIEGGKTQGALEKFLRDRKLPADAAGKPDFFDTLFAAARNPQGAGFSWCNDTSYTVMASFGIVEMGAHRHARLVSGSRRPVRTSGSDRRAASGLQLRRSRGQPGPHDQARRKGIGVGRSGHPLHARRPFRACRSQGLRGARAERSRFRGHRSWKPRRNRAIQGIRGAKPATTGISLERPGPGPP